MVHPPLQDLWNLLCQAYIDEPPNPEDGDLQFSDDMWWIKDQVFVPENFFSQFLKDYHDVSLLGHPGSFKTLKAISQTMTWMGIRKDVLNYTKDPQD
ncbi:uncharacterized protein VP01_560g3 [Puccinia sorghi]|uniref:Integrase zinc-binding domain-containing protein n=1 Tax=Puccinia sorghi TaxID=27349 RepID=A0A0L6UL23_9BASI|nr:uncharacterized protein VP01_560g3 [Puccinia sorghi]